MKFLKGFTGFLVSLRRGLEEKHKDPVDDEPIHEIMKKFKSDKDYPKTRFEYKEFDISEKKEEKEKNPLEQEPINDIMKKFNKTEWVERKDVENKD